MNTAYLALKAANNLFGKTPAHLAEAEMARVREVAARQSELENLVLTSAEACDVVIPASTCADALATVRNRYESEDAYTHDLAANGLTPGEFATALERELKVEAILEKVGQRAAAVADIDVDLYYHYHHDQFRRPETRAASHILVTINETLPDNTRAVALARIEAIAARVAKSPGRFEEQALKHSECPTALKGGALGEVRRGQLYPELEAVLFELATGALSGIVESPLGFHLLRCDAISPEAVLTLEEARTAIRKLLESRRRRVCQQAWVKAQKQPG